MPIQNAAELRASLATLDVNVGFARAVVEDMADGLIWVSPTVGAGAVHVVHSYGMSLIWGDRVDEAFEEVVDRLLTAKYREGEEWLQIDPRWAHLPWRERLLSASERLGRDRARPGEYLLDTRINFDLDAQLFHAQRDEVRIPDGWSMHRASTTDFARPGAVVPHRFWRTATDFLAHGGGWQIEKNGAFGALAFTSFRFGNQLELGIETAPAQRRSGLGAAVAAHMIADLVSQGISPVWACRQSNTGSVRLARKLGFVPRRQLDYFGLPSR